MNLLKKNAWKWTIFFNFCIQVLCLVHFHWKRLSLTSLFLIVPNKSIQVELKDQFFRAGSIFKAYEKKKVQALTLYTCFNLALRKCGTTDVIRFNHCSVAVKQRSLVCSKAKLPPQKREKRKKERKREKKGFEQHFGLTFLVLYLHSSSLLAIMNYVHRTKQMWPWGLQIVSL